MEIDELYMSRALQLARRGAGYVSPNPMVGAVVVCDGRIIGEGYHRRYGEAHAEVNAINSVADSALLPRSTVYVTLEPCAHYGKTPPCAALLVRCGVKRVVIGCTDPFAKVAGRGIAMLREAGIDVTTGVLEKECRELNRVFMTAHTLGRPYVMLKWAMSSDGYLDRKRDAAEPAQKFSTELTSAAVHRLRGLFDAVAVGAGTVNADSPRLTVRSYAGRSPRRVILDRHGIAREDAAVFGPGTIYFCEKPRGGLPEGVEQITGSLTPDEMLRELYRRGVTSLMVEGGAAVISGFIVSGLWDEARVEINPMLLGGEGSAHVEVPSGYVSAERMDDNLILTVRNIAYKR
ncbi:MAG: bifunctional diaminohydroxyphosphoribosylaminopyrimidine deaminase/5-amino-6-(5-phosphoribosylamino)uracil reductase RibD [Paramuribaculum sp.]|nr:bifunctional diaminohydroxyphosphoribosylaminopyrimidine deaminase/5-amino-6-(5-phosphoribosylamino)uracil reductase RibD [Paramuribaculum sp.]